MNIRINLTAEIIIIFDDMTPVKQPAPSDEVTLVRWMDLEPSERLPNGKIRKDKGQPHHCSRCGTEGRRALRRLNGRCHTCKDFDFDPKFGGLLR